MAAQKSRVGPSDRLFLFMEMYNKPFRWGTEGYRKHQYDRWSWHCHGLPKTCPFCSGVLEMPRGPDYWINNLSDTGPNGGVVCWNDVNCIACNLFGKIYKYEQTAGYERISTSVKTDLTLGVTQGLW